MGKRLVPSEPTNTDTITEWMFDTETAIDTIPPFHLLLDGLLDFG